MKEKETSASFPAKLLELRSKRGWSQATLAAHINMDEESVRRWEKGKGRPSLYAQQKLREVFEVPPEELGLGENLRLKRTHSASPVDPVPPASENDNGFLPVQEYSTQRQEEMYGLLHPPVLPALRGEKWQIFLTYCLLLALCLFGLGRWNLFQSSLSDHQPTSPPTVTPPSHVYYSFEDGTDQWFSEGHILSLQSSSAYAKQGSYSLKVIFRSFHAEDYPFIQVVPSAEEPLSAGQTISLYVYVPTTSPTLSVHPFIMAGSDWDWFTPPHAVTIAPRIWTKITYTVPAGVTSAKRVGIQFGSIPVNVVGTIYIDAVGWN